MTSPFSTIEEFNAAADGPTEGAIYTFANTPIVNILALLVAVGIFVWFIVATYSTHAAAPAAKLDKSLNHLSSFFVIGLLSLVAADHRQVTPAERAETAPQTRLSQVSRRAPLGLLGMVSIGLPTFRRTTKRRQRLARNLKASRSRH